MNYFRQTSAQGFIGFRFKLLTGYLLVSIGILLAAGGGSWDINNHLLNKPETFFAPPHAVLYSGAAIAVAGALMLFLSAKRSGNTMIWPIKLTVAGVLVLIIAGPVDFMWHSAYGLDGLLSPPHFVLVSGMVASSVGSLAGMVYHNSLAFREFRLSPALIIIGMLPVWLAASGMIDLFSLPFSHTSYFNFDPHPVFAVTFATLAFPLLISVLTSTSSALAGRRFGVLTAISAAFIVTGLLTSIIPNDALITTIPFYVANIVPFAAADVLLSFSKSKISVYAAGAIAGLAFFMVYYPLITYTYNQMQADITIWPSLIALTYFQMIGSVFPLVMAPAVAMGILGAIASNKLLAKNKSLS
jgi:hypothetical protein